MYASIRRYKIDPKNMETFKKRIPEAAKIIGSKPGCKSYYVVVEGDSTVVSISVFNDQSGAQQSVETAAKWVKETIPGVLGPPEIVTSEVVAQK